MKVMESGKRSLCAVFSFMCKEFKESRIGKYRRYRKLC